jgi:hypothetical protein
MGVVQLGWNRIEMEPIMNAARQVDMKMSSLNLSSFFHRLLMKELICTPKKNNEQATASVYKIGL